jgi:hypothetical protein
MLPFPPHSYICLCPLLTISPVSSVLYLIVVHADNQKIFDNLWQHDPGMVPMATLQGVHDCIQDDV